MSEHYYRTLGKFDPASLQMQYLCQPSLAQYNASREELKCAYERIAELESALRHAQEAVFWHDGGKFEQDGKTIEEVLGEVLP